MNKGPNSSGSFVYYITVFNCLNAPLYFPFTLKDNCHLRKVACVETLELHIFHSHIMDNCSLITSPVIVPFIFSMRPLTIDKPNPVLLPVRDWSAI